MVIGLRGAKRPWRRSSGEVEQMAVGQPGELGGKLVALARGRGDGRGEAILEMPGADAFQPADMVDIGDDALAELRKYRCKHRHAAGRHVYDLARKFAPVRQHVAAEQVHFHTLETAAFFAVRKDARVCLSEMRNVAMP